MIRALAAAAAVLALAACQAIPVSGPVREGLSNLDLAERSVQFTPSGPQPGATQEEIVRGFVRAALSSVNDYEVAREFLSPDYERQWDPSYGVMVDDGSLQYDDTSENIGVLSFGLIATVDGSGTLVTVEPDKKTEVPFELTQVRGEWRISSAPAGVILGRDTFTTTWVPRQLYFLNGADRLVPETHWFLNRQTLTTQVVRELMSGPSEQMQTVLHTAFPAGTTLTSGTVPVNDGIAFVDVTPELFDADVTAMEHLKRQLAASLQTVAGVTGYQLAVQGAVIESGTVSGPDDTASTEHQYVVALKDDQFGVAAAGEVQPIDGLGPRVVSLQPQSVSMSVDRGSAAVLSEVGVHLVTTDETMLIEAGPGRLTPSIDNSGYVWTYDRAAPGVITVGQPFEARQQLQATWLTGTPVAVRVSLGGNRIAVLVNDDGSSVVYVGGIERDASGRPIALSEDATPQLWTAGQPIDLDWISDTRFAALVQAGPLGGSAKVQIGAVGQFATEAGAVAGAATVSGGGRQLIRVLDEKGAMFAPQGLVGWQQQQTGVELVAKVG